jgi:CheY-like chemotaxis protein
MDKPQREKAPRPGARALRVLIVDDSQPVRQMVAKVCALLPGCEVAGFANNGVEALERIRALTPDVITLDLRMPEMDGLEVLQAIRDQKLSCKTIVLSGTLEDAHRAECLRLGASFVFDKATETDKLIQALRRSVTDQRIS